MTSRDNAKAVPFHARHVRAYHGPCGSDNLGRNKLGWSIYVALCDLCCGCCDNYVKTGNTFGWVLRNICRERTHFNLCRCENTLPRSGHTEEMLCFAGAAGPRDRKLACSDE